MDQYLAQTIGTCAYFAKCRQRESPEPHLVHRGIYNSPSLAKTPINKSVARKLGGTCRRFSLLFLSISALGIGLPACSAHRTELEGTAEYDALFSSGNHTAELQTLMGAIRIIYHTAYYDKYLLPATAQIGPSKIDTESLEEITRPEPMVHSASATATVISYKHPHIALLSCAHLFDSPDTILAYHATQTQAKHIQSVAIKRDERIVVPGFKSGNPWLILAQDRKQDIAILGRELAYQPTEAIDVFAPHIGQSKTLGWGTFIYLLAYPKGVKTITRGIVSQPNKDKRGAFLVDALFNQGSSGGIVLASKGEGARFELVGMAVSVSGYEERVLVPAKDNDVDETAPFTGEIAVSTRTVIDYGITNVVSTEAILELIAQNRAALLERGYDLDFSVP